MTSERPEGNPETAPGGSPGEPRVEPPSGSAEEPSGQQTGQPGPGFQVDESAIELPAGAGEPWRIPGVDRLPEGEGRALFLSRPDGGPVLEVVLCRVDGRLFALDSTCPHAGGRIQGGPLVEGRYARCPLHWFDFDPHDGTCVNVECEPATTYRVEEREGVALLWLDAG